MATLTLAELSLTVDLAEVGFDEVSARRTPEPDAPDGVRARDLEVSATRSADRIVVRCVAERQTSDARYRVAVHGTFQAREAFDVDHEVMTAFVEQIGVTSLYPYLREAMSGLSNRLGAAPVLLPLIQPGQIRLGLSGTTSSG